MTERLAGKVAFVAGASRGIGATVAAALAREGAAVAVAARSEQEGKVPGTIHSVAERITSAGGRALPVQCDVTSEESVEKPLSRRRFRSSAESTSWSPTRVCCGSDRSSPRR